MRLTPYFQKLVLPRLCKSQILQQSDKVQKTQILISDKILNCDCTLLFLVNNTGSKMHCLHIFNDIAIVVLSLFSRLLKNPNPLAPYACYQKEKCLKRPVDKHMKICLILIGPTCGNFNGLIINIWIVKARILLT